MNECVAVLAVCEAPQGQPHSVLSILCSTVDFTSRYGDDEDDGDEDDSDEDDEEDDSDEDDEEDDSDEDDEEDDSDEDGEEDDGEEDDGEEDDGEATPVSVVFFYCRSFIR